MKWDYQCKVRRRGREKPEPPLLEWEVYEGVFDALTETDAFAKAHVQRERWCPERLYEYGAESITPHAVSQRSPAAFLWDSR